MAGNRALVRGLLALCLVFLAGASTACGADARGNQYDQYLEAVRDSLWDPGGWNDDTLTRAGDVACDVVTAPEGDGLQGFTEALAVEVGKEPSAILPGDSAAIASAAMVYLCPDWNE